jgi:hypothetical protein
LPDLLGPPSSSGRVSTVTQLEQWGLLGDGSSGSASTASSSGASSPRPLRTPCRRRAPPPSRFRLEPPLPPLETGATAYSDMAFQIWTSSVSSRSAPLSACHGTRHLAQWTRTEMSGGREREGGARAGGSLLEHDDAADEGGPEGGAGSHALLELTWWRSRIPRTARRGGGRRATLRSTATHPSAMPSRATPTSCSALASAWTCERETERDRERAREDKDRPCPRVGIRPRPRGDKGGRFFSPSAWGVQNFRRLLVSADVGSRYQK